MNVGRNYNGPKVVREIYFSHKDWDCFNFIEYFVLQNISYGVTLDKLVKKQ